MPGASDHTFLFADLVGFTALAEARGDELATEVVGEFVDGVRVALPDYGAEEIKTLGDAVLIRCPDAAAAVRLGVRIAREVSRRPNFPDVRVGMHTGPAIERGGDWFGVTVNLAARISALAGEGQVLISETTRDGAGDLEGIGVRARGIERLRNVARAVALFEVFEVAPWEPGAFPRARAIGRAAPRQAVRSARPGG